MNYIRKPLNWQNNDLSKAQKLSNPSYESFRDNEVHPEDGMGGKMESRSTVGAGRYLRRYPDGSLDVPWVSHLIIQAVKDYKAGTLDLTPVQKAVLTAVFPKKFDLMLPKQAEIYTQLSKEEKNQIEEYVMVHFMKEANYNAGRGGGNVLPDYTGMP